MGSTYRSALNTNVLYVWTRSFLAESTYENVAFSIHIGGCNETNSSHVDMLKDKLSEQPEWVIGVIKEKLTMLWSLHLLH